MKLAAITCIAISTAAVPAWAATWDLSGQNGVAKYYLDRDSIGARNGRLKAWTQLVYTKPQKVPGQEPYIRSLELKLFDCESRTVGVQQRAYYTSDGASTGWPYSTDAVAVTMHDVIPDTSDETFLVEVCTHRQPTSK